MGHGQEDSGEVPITKRTVDCNGVKIRMEFYPGRGPQYCPVCGEWLGSSIFNPATGKRYPIKERVDR